MSNNREIPQFNDEDEEREFWATHDSTEYVDWSNVQSKSTAESKVYAGSLPKSQLDLVLRWAVTHNKELMENWDLARKGMPLRQIAPLVER